MRRHGDARQVGVTKAQLRPYVVAVCKIVRRNHDSPVWAQLDARWLAVVAEAEAAVREAQGGHPFIGWEQRAQSELVRLARTVPARDVVETVCAMYLLAEQEPRRFMGDRAFLFQLARRVRGLTEANVGITWDNKAGRNKRVYCDLRPAATEHFAVLVVRALGASALQLSKSQAAQEKAIRAERVALYERIEGLK